MSNDSDQLTAEELRTTVRDLLAGWPTVSEYLTLVPAAMLIRLCDASETLEKRVAELEAEVYGLQANDPHMAFISRVQNAGLHEEWTGLCDKLAAIEGDSNG